MSLHDFMDKIVHNLFQPLLLFFYMGFLIPILRVGFEFPHQVYQGLVIFLLVSIGWHGGEELAALEAHELYQALGFMAVGFVVNFLIGIFAYVVLRVATRLRRIDAATVAAYYGSDSAGTFATCVGVLATLQAGVVTMAMMNANLTPTKLGVPDADLPKIAARLGLEDQEAKKFVAEVNDKTLNLATLGAILRIKDLDLPKLGAALEDDEIVDKWQKKGLKVELIRKVYEQGKVGSADYIAAAYMPVMLAVMEIPGCLVGLYLVARLRRIGMDVNGNMHDEPGYDPTQLALANSGGGHGNGNGTTISVEGGAERKHSASIFSPELLHEVFLNTGIFLLFGGIAVGYISRSQGPAAVAKDDPFFNTLFHGLLCLYLLEMGLTASKRLADLKVAGWRFILFGILAPNVFATIGMVVAHFYSELTGAGFTIGTYMLFAVLCAAASYIAVPAIQRLVIPEASPTLPLAASLGLTFSYNVTIGITVYEFIAQWLQKNLPF